MIDPIYIGQDAIEELVRYCKAHQVGHLAVIADSNTYVVLGQRVEQTLRSAGHEVTTILFSGTEVIADERYLVRALVQAPLGSCTFVAVGSGTITDITRFVSHRTGRHFIAIPTAPSVDGYTSLGAPLMLSGVKTTLTEQAPMALFADLETLGRAPHRLIAAGFGDVAGKLTALADWKLGSLLWSEPFDPTIYARTEAAAQSCLEIAAEIGQGTKQGVLRLMQALVECGLCMLEMGSSLPASGAEHHVSHYWEIQSLRQHQPPLLHGAKVGVALTRVARQYARIRQLTRNAMMRRMKTAILLERDQELARIRQGYGSDLSEGVIEQSAPFLDLTAEGFEALKHRIVAQWDAIRAVAERVPSEEDIVAYLRQAGAPTTAQSLGLSEQDVKMGLAYAHYLRNRFTVLKLSRMLNVPVT
jgi:glycerol-1-phosphate dehydrogenase [NAD(P)+]